jgi:HAD superfamily phosphatase (TIGR01668 family)
MLEKLYPDEWVESSYQIDYQKYYDMGYRGIIFDIDNTLVPHGMPATKASILLFENLRKIGFKTCLISNNKKKRVHSFAKDVRSKYIYDAHKPSIEGYIKGMYKMETNLKNTLFIGDQLFTDIWGAKKTGLYTILVTPIHPKEEIQIRLKRILEKPILKAYEKNK